MYRFLNILVQNEVFQVVDSETKRETWFSHTKEFKIFSTAAPVSYSKCTFSKQEGIMLQNYDKTVVKSFHYASNKMYKLAKNLEFCSVSQCLMLFTFQEHVIYKLAWINQFFYPRHSALNIKDYFTVSVNDIFTNNEENCREKKRKIESLWIWK